MDILSGFLWHPWISNINGIYWDFINLSHLLEVCWLCKKSWSQLQTCETDLELNVINSESEIMMKLLWEDVTWLVLRNSKGSKFKSIIILIITDCGYPICVMSQISCNVWKMFLIHVLPSFLNNRLAPADHCIIWLSHSPRLWFASVSVNYCRLEYLREEDIPFHFLLCIATCQPHYFIRLVKWFLGKLIAAAAQRIISGTRTPRMITKFGVQSTFYILNLKQISILHLRVL